MKSQHRPTKPKTSRIYYKYQQIFKGVGKLKDFQSRLHKDKNQTPVTQPTRRQPHYLHGKFEQKLNDNKANDITEKVNKPSHWISPMVVTPKPNTDHTRAVADMRRANTILTKKRVTPNTQYKGKNIQNEQGNMFFKT